MCPSHNVLFGGYVANLLNVLLFLFNQLAKINALELRDLRDLDDRILKLCALLKQVIVVGVLAQVVGSDLYIVLEVEQIELLLFLSRLSVQLHQNLIVVIVHAGALQLI